MFYKLNIFTIDAQSAINRIFAELTRSKFTIKIIRTPKPSRPVLSYVIVLKVVYRWCTMLRGKSLHMLFGCLHKNLSVNRLPSRISVVSQAIREVSRMSYSVVERGSPFSIDYRVYIRKDRFLIKVQNT